MMKKNTLLLSAFGAVALAATTGITVAEVVPVPDSVTLEKISDAKPRNVVFILSDDHRYDAMSFMGHPIAVTPSMDAMAKEGVHLKNAFVTTSLCSPSRASILTGLYTFRHRVIDNQRLVPEGTLFFPQYLQKAGYKTGFIGKWHMGSSKDDPRPGFDYWVSFKGQGKYYPPNDNYTINVNGENVPQDGYITTLLSRYAVEFLEDQMILKDINSRRVGRPRAEWTKNRMSEAWSIPGVAPPLEHFDSKNTNHICLLHQAELNRQF